MKRIRQFINHLESVGNPTTLPKDTSSLGTQATTPFDSKESALPKPEADGRLKTLNNMGYVTTYLDPFSQDFVDFASTAKLPVLDGGAAFGIATVAALKKGATVVANDMDQKHLDLIAQNETLTKDDRSRLFLKPGALPLGIDFPENSLMAIHLCRVMHFFPPKDVELMFEKASQWLAPTGRFYLVTGSPYHFNFQGFLKVYRKRVQNGEEWPGVLTSFTQTDGKEHEGKVQPYLHILDEKVLIRVASKYGFIVKKMELFPDKSNLSRSLGLDYIGAIFVKMTY